jgi:RNA polymerase sigma-70 factor, ECF subfamily
MDDDSLMIRVQSGDSAAFEEIVCRYQRPLTGFFYRNTRDWGLAEDLTQETLLKLYDRAWDYLPLGRFRGWMYRIARNLLIDNVRRQASDALIRSYRGRAGDDDDGLARLVAEVASPDDRLTQTEFVEIIDLALAEIPEDQRQTFTLHHYSNLPLKEVAEIMQIPLPTCKSRLRLAREKLQEKLRVRGIEAPG